MFFLLADFTDSQNLSIFAGANTAAHGKLLDTPIQQGLFSQAIKENIDDTAFDYEGVSDTNVKSVIEKLKSEQCLALRYYQKEGQISSVSVSDGSMSYYFSEKYLNELKPVIENPDIKKLGYDTKSDYHLLLNNGFKPEGLEY